MGPLEKHQGYAHAFFVTLTVGWLYKGAWDPGLSDRGIFVVWFCLSTYFLCI
jgi:hypothetical protein